MIEGMEGEEERRRKEKTRKEKRRERRHPAKKSFMDIMRHERLFPSRFQTEPKNKCKIRRKTREIRIKIFTNIFSKPEKKIKKMKVDKSGRIRESQRRSEIRHAQLVSLIIEYLSTSREELKNIIGAEYYREKQNIFHGFFLHIVHNF